MKYENVGQIDEAKTQIKNALNIDNYRDSLTSRSENYWSSNNYSSPYYDLILPLSKISNTLHPIINDVLDSMSLDELYELQQLVGGDFLPKFNSTIISNTHSNRPLDNASKDAISNILPTFKKAINNAALILQPHIFRVNQRIKDTENLKKFEEQGYEILVRLLSKEQEIVELDKRVKAQLSTQIAAQAYSAEFKMQNKSNMK